MLRLCMEDGALDVLCVGAHPDDIEIGCGATLAGLAARGDANITVAVMTGSPHRVAESTGALEELAPGVKTHFFGLPDGRLPVHWNEAKEHLEELARECRPQLILTHRVDDAHQDHRELGILVTTVWRDALVLRFEIPKWDGDLGAPTHYVPVSDADAHRKVEVLNRHFTSQHARDWWDDELFLGMMRVRGMECRSRYAEAFFVTKAALDLGRRA